MNLTTDRAQGVAIVRIGETRLMYPLLADFSGAVMALLTSGDKKVMIDLSKVTFVASLGIRLLLTTARALAKSGGRLVMFGATPAVSEILETTALSDIIPVFLSEEEAIGALGA